MKLAFCQVCCQADSQVVLQRAGAEQAAPLVGEHHVVVHRPDGKLAGVLQLERAARHDARWSRRLAARGPPAPLRRLAHSSARPLSVRWELPAAQRLAATCTTGPAAGGGFFAARRSMVCISPSTSSGGRVSFACRRMRYWSCRVSSALGHGRSQFRANLLPGDNQRSTVDLLCLLGRGGPRYDAGQQSGEQGRGPKLQATLHEGTPLRRGRSRTADAGLRNASITVTIHTGMIVIGTDTTGT